MIGTIGSLVQETFKRWLIATSLYIAASLGASSLFGLALGAVGYLLDLVVSDKPFSAVRLIITGFFTLAYAASDLGIIRLPRPTLMFGVPASWWQRWGAYRGALAYGGALGLGLTTFIAFGSFYVLCLWCIIVGNVGYGALLMGTYGLARALVLVPASWRVYGRQTSSWEQLAWFISKLKPVREIIVFVLAIF